MIHELYSHWRDENEYGKQDGDRHTKHQTDWQKI
jgi:hypothetical protein